MVHLDAEDLAETGIHEAYLALLPKLKQYVPSPVSIKEIIDNEHSIYIIVVSDTKYEISSPNVPEHQSWGIATFAFFSIVNRQLSKSPIRFYAINSGNDLGGMFLTEGQYKTARRSLKNKKDWPYLPTNRPPWFGQPH